MTREDVLRIIADHRQDLKRLAVKSLSLFGSVARNEAGVDSDIDLLVEFETGHPSGLFEFISLKNFLEDVLRSNVDLIMYEALSESFRQNVLQEAIRAA